MLVETFTVGMLSTNCYVASSQETKEAIIIDPGIDLSSEAGPILNYIAEKKLNINLILNTHGHDDHVQGDKFFQQRFKVPIGIHILDEHFIEDLEKDSFPQNLVLKDGSLIRLGNETLKVLHTPGHTPGSMCLVGEKLVFTGDTLFAGGIGRTDFPGGSMMEMRNSLKKLMELPLNLLVYPGHGESSIIVEEKKSNPFLNNKYERIFF